MKQEEQYMQACKKQIKKLLMKKPLIEGDDNYKSPRPGKGFACCLVCNKHYDGYTEHKDSTIHSESIKRDPLYKMID